MNTQEIFDRLMALTNKLEEQYPLLDTDKALLYDIAKALDLTNEQARQLARDAEPAPRISIYPPAVEPEPHPAMPEPFDFGLGVSSLGNESVADDEAYTAAKMSIAALNRPVRSMTKDKLCDCGHYSAHPMMASLGTSCPDCYDRMS